MTSVNDAYDPTTGEITDFECALYYKLLEVLTKLDDLYTKIDALDSTMTESTATTMASTLVNEYYGGQDMDGNGLVYGIDFYISSEDIPQVLIYIPQDGSPMTWTDYVESMS